MYVIFNIIRVKEEHLEEFLKGVHKHARNSNSEPGCVRYEVLQDVVEPHVVCLYEVFEDESAFNAHREYPYYREWMDNSKNWRHSDQRIRHVLDYIYHPEHEK